jgi:hypothetical protein
VRGWPRNVAKSLVKSGGAVGRRYKLDSPNDIWRGFKTAGGNLFVSHRPNFNILAFLHCLFSQLLCEMTSTIFILEMFAVKKLCQVIISFIASLGVL